MGKDFVRESRGVGPSCSDFVVPALRKTGEGRGTPTLLLVHAIQKPGPPVLPIVVFFEGVRLAE